MREWMMIGIGAVIGVAVGIVISEMFGFSPMVRHIFDVACGAASGAIAVRIATMAGWIKSESNPA
jgi:putative effector of murein hydrolase